MTDRGSRSDLPGGVLDKLLRASERIARASDLRDLAELSFEAAQGLHECDLLAILTENPVRDSLRVEVALGPEAPTEGLELSLESDTDAAVLAALRGEPVLAQDDPEQRADRSELAVPLGLAGRIEGVVLVGAARPGAFPEEDRILFQLFAQSIAVALRNMRARDELQSERDRLETVLQSSADAIAVTDEHGELTYFSPGAEELFGYRASEVVGTKVGELYFRGPREAKQVMDRLLEQGKLKNHETWVRARSGRGVPASLSASLLYDRDGKVVGTLGVLKDITRQKEMEEKLNYTIEKLQEANEKLEYLAVTDNLSGLYNHRHFYRRLEEEVERCVRSGRSLSLILIDIDRFKTFNDRYGHQVGDRVITEIGRVIWTCIRRIDTGCRYGGEEFTVILPETQMEQASIVADRIRGTFAGSNVFRELGVDPATLSAGVAEYRPEGGKASAEEIVRAADEAMYRVKHGGGDGVATVRLEGSAKVEEGQPGAGGGEPEPGGPPEG